jgi:ABC-type transport system substrate-binding protein
MALAIAAGACVAAPVACGRESGPRGRPIATDPERGGTLRLATFSDLRSLEPATAMDTESQPYLNLLFAGLVDYGPSGEIVTDLAERFEIAGDGRTYRFVLRRGVRFHDGEELVADDVKRSIERALHPDTPNPALAFYERILGFASYQARKSDHLEGVVVEGRHVVSFRLERPDATFLSVLALPFLRPVCRSAGRRYDDAFQNAPCGAGPFRFESWQQGRMLRVRRHDGYHGELPWLDAIELRMDVTRLTQRFQFERGDLDGIFNEFERPGAIAFRTHPEWSKYLRTSTVAMVYGDFLNVEMEPFHDVRVRRAVAAAIDRPNWQRYYEGWASVTGHLLPPGIPGHEPNPPYEQRYDLARARALMAEAGFPYDPETGRGGYPKKIVYHAGEGEAGTRYAQLLQYDLAKIGIRIEIKEASFAQYQAVAGRPKSATMGYAGWQLDYADPSSFLEPIFSSRSIAEEDSQNKAFYRNPTLDRLLDEAREELDPARRLSLYREAERIVCDDAPWTFTYVPLRLEITQPWIRGYAPHPIWNRPLKPIWIDQAARRAAFALLGPSRSSAALGQLLPRTTPRPTREMPHVGGAAR